MDILERTLIRLALVGNLAVITTLTLAAELGFLGRVITLAGCWLMTGVAWAVVTNEKRRAQ